MKKEHRNEDLEFNNRIILAGYKILLSPRLKSIYFSRDNIINFITQAFDNGYIVTNRIRKQRFHNFRHYVPLFYNFFNFSIICSLLKFKYTFNKFIKFS